MPLNAQIMLSILAHETSAGDLSKTLRATPASYAVSLTDGTGANQAQVVWSFEGTFDGEYTLGSNGLVFSDNRGTVDFSALKAIYIKNTGSIDFYVSGWPDGPISENGSAFFRPGAAALFVCPDANGWPANADYAFGLNAGDDSPVASAQVVLIGEGTVT
jgi:hypothetical protein